MWFRLILSAAVTVAAAATPLAGQSLRRDPGTGDYVLEFTDIDGASHRLVVEPRDKVSPVLDVNIEPSGAVYVYRYALTNENVAGATQPISLVLLPCPGQDASLSVEPAPGWNAHASGVAPFACEFNFRDAWLVPGQSRDGFVVRSVWLPAPASARAFGVASPAALPVSVGSVPDTVIDLIETVQGFTFDARGGHVVDVVVPGRSPTALDDPAAGLRLVGGDLDAACGDLRWISHMGICRSLRTKLDAAARSLARGNTGSARGQLGSFLQELGAQHGPEPGKHVSDNAYWLLKINVEYVLGRL